MAEFMYWEIGNGAQILINEQAYYDYRRRLEKLDFMVCDYISLVNGRDPVAHHSVDGYIGLSRVDEQGGIGEVYLNVENIELAVTYGGGDSQVTNVLMNFSDEFYHTIETAEQISRAGMCGDFDNTKFDNAKRQNSKSPHVYDCPMPRITVAFNALNKASFPPEQIAVIERHYKWASDRVTILPYFIYGREDLQDIVPKQGEANFSTQTEELGKISYIYPSDYS